MWSIPFELISEYNDLIKTLIQNGINLSWVQNTKITFEISKYLRSNGNIKYF